MADSKPSSSEAATDTGIMTRVDLFDVAYKLIKGCEWPDGYGVHDVISLARFLETGEDD
jgi:hypothetical protein